MSSGTREGAQRANAAAALLQSLDLLSKAMPEVKQSQSQTRFAELASVGGAAAMPGISARQDATKQVADNTKRTADGVQQLVQQQTLLR